MDLKQGYRAERKKWACWEKNHFMGSTEKGATALKAEGRRKTCSVGQTQEGASRNRKGNSIGEMWLGWWIGPALIFLQRHGREWPFSEILWYGYLQGEVSWAFWTKWSPRRTLPNIYGFPSPRRKMSPQERKGSCWRLCGSPAGFSDAEVLPLQYYSLAEGCGQL